MISSSKAETVLVVVLGALLLLNMWGWTKNNLDLISSNTGDRKNKTLECGKIEITYVDFKSSKNGTTVFLESNQDIDNFLLTSSSSEGIKTETGAMRSGTLHKVPTPFNSSEEIYGKLPWCSRTFR